MRRGEIWSASTLERPILIIQSDEFNESAIPTLLCAVLSDNLDLARAPGNVHLTRRTSGLPEDTVANVAHLVTLEKQALRRRTGRLSPATMRGVDVGLRLVLALSIR